ncbi:HD domain-containing protein [Candidatus Saccharibacteria bacterium]|nr:HD domain-containing protein [Candidatus Saccharibacteria bacterium]
MGILQEYRRIMTEEYKLRAYSQPAHLILNSGYIAPQEEIHWEVDQIMEDIKLSTVPRYITHWLDLDNRHFVEVKNEDGSTRPGVLESVSAHTHLLGVLVSRALSKMYGPDFGDPESEHPRTVDGYTFRQIMEACRLHDLPENDIGDIPDDGNMGRANKAELEVKYYREKIYHKYSPRESELRGQAFKLLDAMDDPTSATGRLLHVADKSAAVLTALVYG